MTDEGVLQSLAAPLVDEVVVWNVPVPSGQRPYVVAAWAVQLWESSSVVPSGRNRRAESAAPRPKTGSTSSARNAPAAIVVPAAMVKMWVSSLSLTIHPDTSTGRRTGVDQFDPVARRTAVRLDLVELHDRRGCAAVVGRALGGRGGRLEGAGSVRAAAVRRRGVGGPAVGVLERRAVWQEQAGGVCGAEPEDRVDVERQEGACGDRRARCDGEDVGVVVVLDDPPGHVDGRRTGVDEFDPIARRTAVGLDLIDPHSGRNLLVRPGRRRCHEQRNSGQ